MGIITNYLRFVKGSEVKNIFTYANGKSTLNNVFIRDLNKVVIQLIADGYRLSA